MFGIFKKKKLPQQTATTNKPTAITLNNAPEWTNFSADNAVTEGYKSASWVYACVKKRADAIASIPIEVQIKTADGWQHSPMHPLQQLLDNPSSDLDYGEIMRLFVTQLDLLGNGLLLKVKSSDNSRTLELFPLLAQYIKQVKKGTHRLIDGYEYQAPNTARMSFDSSDVVHTAYTNPDSLTWGQAPLQACGKGVDVDNAAQDWQRVSMGNRGVPDGVFSIDADLTPDQFDQAVQSVRDQYANASNAKSPWVMSKATYTQMAMTPIEMDYINTRNFSKEQICACYGVPPEMINAMGNANRASSESSRKTFWIDTIVPLASEIEKSLTLNLARDYGRDVRIKFDLSGVPALQENYSEKIANAEKLFSMGVPMTAINKKLELGFDDEELPHGDTAYIRQGVIPASFDADMMIDQDPSQASNDAYGN